MSDFFNAYTIAIAGLILLGGVLTLLAMSFRRVVATNEVHIVQSAKSTTSYGKDTNNGNTYYEWPSWVPVLGITKIVLPVSVFDLDLNGYEAYDKGRLPFVVDVKAFFRVADSNVAAQRVSSFTELHNQLKAIVQGAVRVILASNDIEEIMQGRSKFGEEFTKEVNGQLSNWGVETVKNIELMDLRDHKETFVIKNIMEKKKSHIEMESRMEVAKNMRAAQMAEIEAKKEVDLRSQDAQQSVGLRTTEANREVDIAKQNALQLLKEQEKITKEKEMNILKVQELRKAEILKEVTLLKAQQDKEVTVFAAEGRLESEKKEAEAVMVKGQAKADAEKAMQLAPVQAQITLAKEIGENASYQKYLVTLEQIKANENIMKEQAKALEKANIKIIANSGTATEGLNSVGELFTAKGGTQLGAMLEGLSQTDTGKAVLNAVGVKSDEK